MICTLENGYTIYHVDRIHRLNHLLKDTDKGLITKDILQSTNDKDKKWITKFIKKRQETRLQNTKEIRQSTQHKKTGGKMHKYDYSYKST